MAKDVALPPTLGDVLDAAYAVGKIERNRVDIAHRWALWTEIIAEDPYTRACWQRLANSLHAILVYLDLGHDGYDRVFYRQEVSRLTEYNRKLRADVIRLGARVAELEAVLAEWEPYVDTRELDLAVPGGLDRLERAVAALRQRAGTPTPRPGVDNG